MRPLVICPPLPKQLAALLGSPPDAPPPAVGIMRSHSPDLTLTVIVKVTYAIDGGSLRWASEQLPLELDRVWGERAPGMLLRYPSDFVPFKPQTDVLVVGHAYAEVGRRAPHVDAQLVVGTLSRSFAAEAAEPSERIPLWPSYLRTPTGGRMGGVGPMKPGPDPTLHPVHDEEFDYDVYQVAPVEQRLELLPPSTVVQLHGLSARGSLQLELPSVAPRVLARWRNDVSDTELLMRADTLWLDTDTDQCVVVWRGVAPMVTRESLDRLDVAMVPEDDGRPWQELLRSAARGHVAFVAEGTALDPAPATDEERLAVAAARHELIAQPLAAEPTLSLEAYASISAELAEQREPRATVLRRLGFDEDSWTVEERAWLEALADQAKAGDGTQIARYGELFVTAQDRLGTAEEAALSTDQYVRLAITMETATEPNKELERHELRLAQWMRIDRRFQRRAMTDPAFGAQLDALLHKERDQRAGSA